MVVLDPAHVERTPAREAQAVFAKVKSSWIS